MREILAVAMDADFVPYKAPYQPLKRLYCERFY